MKITERLKSFNSGVKAKKIKKLLRKMIKIICLHILDKLTDLKSQIQKY